MPRPYGKPCSTGANAGSATTNYPERRSRNQSNLGFQPDRSCRLPSLLIRDQPGCPFDETGKMPVLPVTLAYEEFAQAANISIDGSTNELKMPKAECRRTKE